MADKPRTSTSVRLTTSERQFLDAMASELDQTMSGALRQLIQTKMEKDPLEHGVDEDNWPLPPLQPEESPDQALDLRALLGQILEIDNELFEQIAAPVIDAESRDMYLERAAIGAIGYVLVAHPYSRADPQVNVWLLVLEEGRLWRWSLIDADGLEDARIEYPWLVNIPQVFVRERRQTSIGQVVVQPPGEG